MMNSRKPTLTAGGETAPRRRVRASLVDHLDRGLIQATRTLEKVDLAARLLRGEVDREEYLFLLQQYLILYRSLDKAIEKAVHLPFLNRPSFRREEIVKRDLRLLRGHAPVRTTDEMDRFHGRVLEMAEAPHAGLLGVVYALEHERKRSLKYVKQLGLALKAKVAPRNGLDLHLEATDRSARRLVDLREWVAQNIRDKTGAQEVLQGTAVLMRTLVAMHRDVELRMKQASRMRPGL